MGTILDKANILTKTKLDTLDTKQYPNQAFITTDERDGELDENLAVQFAESERQKSKNLFNINAPRFVQGWHTSVSGNTITVEAGGDTTDDAVFELIPVKENKTYYIGAYSNNQRIQFKLYDTNKNPVKQNPSGWIYNQYWEGFYKDFDTTDIITQMTIPSGVAYIAFFTSWFGGEIIFSNLIVSEYPDVEDYQPYNGAIVHEKEVAGQILWENPKPTTSFGTQDITLNSSEYDYLEIYWFGSTSNLRSCVSIFDKNSNNYGFIMSWASTHANGAISYVRNADVGRHDGDFTKVHFEVAWEAQGTTSEFVQNYACIPYKIIGYKRS